MAEVYKAYDSRLQRYVARRFLRGDDPPQIARMLQEARAQPPGLLAAASTISSPPSRICRAWTRAVERGLANARSKGLLPADADLPGLASFVLTTMEGAVTQARTHRDL